MAIVPSDCLTGCLGVDTVTGLPGNIIDPNGGLECGPNGLRQSCPPRDIGLIGNGSDAAAGIGQAIPANTDVIITDGVNPWLARASYTNPFTCSVRLHFRVTANVQGVGMAAYSQSTQRGLRYRRLSTVDRLLPCRWGRGCKPIRRRSGGLQGLSTCTSRL
jgi:hypothetical protein